MLRSEIVEHRTTRRAPRWLAIVLVVSGASAAAAQTAGDNYATGALPTPPEIYDAAPRQPMFRAAVPVKVDLTSFAPKPDTQGQQGSCAAWATTYAARTILGTMQGGAKEATFSPALTYNLGMRIQAQKYGNTKFDCQSGLMIPVALDLLRDNGALRSTQFPYDAAHCDRLPTAAEDAAAGLAKIGGWDTLDSRDAVRQALAQSRPVVFAMPVGQDFFQWQGDRVFTTPANPGQNWHALTIIGYDDEKSAFRVINSWGTDWGDHGYFWLSYDAFDALARYQGRLQAYAVIPTAQSAEPAKPVIDQADPEIGLATIRNSLTCGDLKWQKQGTAYSVQGYVGSDQERASVSAAIAKVAPGARVEVDVLPWPQCEVRRRLTNFVGGPPISLTANGTAVQSGAGLAHLKQGDFFTLGAGVEPAARHLTVVYIQADGTAVPLYSGALARDVTSIELGTGNQAYRVSAPFGPEAIVAVASDGPVFPQLPKAGVAERQFLDMLNRQLMEATQKARPIRVSSLMVVTRTN